MKFGTIGAGAVALAFAREALARGHEVVLSSRHGPDGLANRVAELGRGASAASIEEAASLEYVLLAVPWPRDAAERVAPAHPGSRVTASLGPRGTSDVSPPSRQSRHGPPGPRAPRGPGRRFEFIATVEAGGIEPPSEGASTSASTCVACVLISPRSLPQAGSRAASRRLFSAPAPPALAGAQPEV